METVTVKGLAELREALMRTIPAEMQGKVLQKALGAGTRITVAEARMRAPVKTGRMKKAIYATRDKAESKPAFESRAVLVRRGKRAQKSNRDAYYWKFVEFGHRTGAKKGQYLEKNGRRSKGRAVKATGMVAPQPFMRPAFEASKYRANDAIAQALGKAIEDAARKARW